jgi:fatty-acyl-CoA synthase
MQAPYSRTVFELLCEQAAACPARPVAITAAGEVSYAALADRARRVAQGLRAEGIERGDAIGLLAGNCTEWLEIFFAVSALSAVVTVQHLVDGGGGLPLLRDSGVRFSSPWRSSGARFRWRCRSLAGSGAAPRLKRSDRRAGAAGIRERQLSGWGHAGGLPAAKARRGGHPRHPLYVRLEQSAEGVPLRHYAVIENGFNIGERQGLVPGDRVFVSVPLFWSYGAVNALRRR